MHFIPETNSVIILNVVLIPCLYISVNLNLGIFDYHFTISTTFLISESLMATMPIFLAFFPMIVDLNLAQIFHLNPFRP